MKATMYTMIGPCWQMKMQCVMSIMILLFVRRVKWKELRLPWCVDGATSWQQTHLNPQRNSTMAKAKTKRTRHQAKIHPIRITDSIVSEIFLLTYLLTKTIYISKKLPLLSKRQKINPEFFQTSPAQSYLWYAPKK